jgi:hypothetical protein
MHIIEKDGKASQRLISRISGFSIGKSQLLSQGIARY